MQTRIRAAVSLLVCLLLLIQGAAGATAMLCQHHTLPVQVVADAGSGDCPGHTEAGQAGPHASAPGPAAHAHAADAGADDASAGCDCQLCLVVPHGVLPHAALPSPVGLGPVLHAPQSPAPASIPPLQRLKPPRHPA